jgi:DNA-3-methyladenine glycosylase II
VRTFTLTACGPFSLAASTRFLEGFTPAAYGGGSGGPLELAFPAEGTWQTVGVQVRQDPGQGRVVGELVHPADADDRLTEVVGGQVARILSLDVDGSGFAAVADRDRVVARLQQRYPGLRPAGFWSPYEAAAWTVIGHRIRIRQAAGIKAAMASELGEQVTVGDRVIAAFPAPEKLAALTEFRGLSGRKPEWLRGIARAALDGYLDGARLRALPREQALAELKRLGGIGDFSAELILLRGACDPDALALHEPRLARAVGRAYRLGGPATAAQLTEISDRWRPYRTWVTLLLRTELEDDTGEIAGNGLA